MIEFFKTWTEGIIVVVFLSIIIEFLLHESKYKKIVNIVTNIYLVFVILNPILKFDIDELNFEELYENVQIEETSAMDISNITKDVYIANIKNEILKIADLNSIKIHDIKVDILNEETGELQNIKVSINDLSKKEAIKKLISEKYDISYENVYVEVK